MCSVLTRAGIDRHPREGPAEVWREELAEGICMEDAEVRWRMHQRVHIGWRALAEEKMSEE